MQTITRERLQEILNAYHDELKPFLETATQHENTLAMMRFSGRMEAAKEILRILEHEFKA